MALYPAIPAKSWSVTDQQMMSLIQLATLEPDSAGATWPSAMWSQAEVVDYLNNRQRRFLHETGITRAISFLTGLSGHAVYSLPQTTIDLRRIAWAGGPAPTGFVELARVDHWELDEGTDLWPAAAAQVPSEYAQDLLSPLSVLVSPTPNDLGQAEITTTDTGAAFTGAGVAASIPDDWTPYLVWGVLADMLSKSGEANDPDRAGYCESRWSEGIELARLLAEGTN